MPRRLTLIGCIVMTLAVTECARETPNLSPEYWSPGDLAAWSQRNQTYGQPYPIMEAARGMVAANAEALAVRAGLEALTQGGTAMDAAVTTSLAQVALQAGAGLSFAGQMTLLYYEAHSGHVHGLDASFNTVLAETDPYSIPPVDSPSGRSVLVPGLMRGFEVAHHRFGRLSWSAVLEPAIYFAATGFAVDSRMARRLESRQSVLNRFPATNRVFTKENEDPYDPGDIFRQPDLARTLREVATRGTDYLYRGAWAEEFVNAVQADGGKMGMEDLRGYEPLWTEPLATTFHGYRVFAPGAPSFGGASLAEALNLLELAAWPTSSHYRDDAPSLQRLIEITQVADLLGPPMGGVGVPPGLIDKHFPGLDLSLNARATKAHAKRVWAEMNSAAWNTFQVEADAARKEGAELLDRLMTGGWGRNRTKKPEHTSGVVAVDADGNVVAVMHSINGSFWGNGLMVGGISVPDPGAFQQHLIASVAPGAKLPEPDNPVIVLADGRPILASSDHGVGIHEVAVQGLLNVLAFHLDPKVAAEIPTFGKSWPHGRPLRLLAGEGGFDESTLLAVRRNGLPLEIVTRREDASFSGYWVAIAIDSLTRRLRAGITPGFNGGAVGY